MVEILELIEKNSRLSEEQLSRIMNVTEEEIKKAIALYEGNSTIIGYTAIINWEKVNREKVHALIEVKVTPQRGEGFDKVAERIFRYPEVNSCYLMSGGYDLAVIIEGMTMKEVALFVAEKLAPMDAVMSTATHFVLKKYKDRGMIFEENKKDEREAIVLWK
jgi:DNA-binding Lrp family transcriptional regulator